MTSTGREDAYMQAVRRNSGRYGWRNIQDVANDQHEIPKEPSVKKGRISLTFRQLV